MNRCLMTIFLIGAMQMSACANDTWVFFDLGNTVINVKDKKNFKYFDGSREYIKQLRTLGFKLGVISNIPESFGSSYDEN